MVAFQEEDGWSFLKIHAGARHRVEPLGHACAPARSADKGHVCTLSAIRIAEDWLVLRHAPEVAAGWVDQTGAAMNRAKAAPPS